MQTMDRIGLPHVQHLDAHKYCYHELVCINS